MGFGSRCCGGSPLFPVLSFVTVGHWVIGRPRNGSGGGQLKLSLYRFLGFLVMALPMVHSAQRQQGGGLRVLGTNCSLHESEFRLYPEVVLDWFPRFADQGCARLTDSWLWPMALCRTFGHGGVVCPCLSVLVPIGLHAVTALVALTVSSGFILAPPPYQMVNAGSYDYKKKKKKKGSQTNDRTGIATCFHHSVRRQRYPLRSVGQGSGSRSSKGGGNTSCSWFE